MRKPSRTRGSRYGALLIDSMPPATAISMSPVWMPCCASITALRPEPHTLLIGERRDVIGEAALERRLPRGRLADAARHDVAHDAFVHHAGSMPARRTASRTTIAPSCGAGEVLERAEKLAGRKPNGADDDGFTHDSTLSKLPAMIELSALRRRAPRKPVQADLNERRRLPHGRAHAGESLVT